jgi:hypothetical protein
MCGPWLGVWERGIVFLLLLTLVLSLTTGHSGLQLTTPIIVSKVGGLYQTIWDTMERYFRLEILSPLLQVKDLFRYNLPS